MSTASCAVSTTRRLTAASCRPIRKEVPMYDRLRLTNMLRSEVERIPETGLPLDVFPARIQELVLNLARYENFNVEYTASILLSAVATAIGNSCRIRIKGEWKTSPSIYMMLVGRPGLGKTPPLGFLYNRSASSTTGCTRSTTRSGTPMKGRLPRPEPGATVRRRSVRCSGSRSW